MSINESGDDEGTGPVKNEQFARVVRELTARRGWSVRAAEAYTGVGRTTVERMQRGIVPRDAEDIIQFALAAAEKGREIAEARRLLQEAGKEHVLALLDAVERQARSIPAVDGDIVLTPCEGTLQVAPSNSTPAVRFRATEQNLTVVASVMRIVTTAEENLAARKDKDSERG